MKTNARSAFALLLLTVLGCKSKAQPPNAALPGADGAPAAVASSSLALLDGFEGEIALTAKGKLAAKEGSANAPLTITLLVKDGKFRFDLPEGLAGARELGKAYVLVTPADKKLYAVMDAKKQAVLVDLDKLAAQAKAFGAARAPAGGKATPPQVTKTGKTDTVAGYKCEIWSITSAQSAGDLCIAEQGTSWFRLPLSGMPAEYAWASEIADGKHFPLRFVATEKGTEQGRVEVTSIERKTLPADQFAVPSGYAVLNLEQMLGAMLGGMPGMAGTLAAASAQPPGGAQLPAGITVPPGVKLPPGFKLPPGLKTPAAPAHP
ncbi:MAG: DUF4412 domain-containing protein [Pseudomonadota bacterium]